jgi:hypothetical protein
VDDQVFCYQCDGGFKNWFAHDDPWTVHAEFFGSVCYFVLKSKGALFIKMAQLKNAQNVIKRPGDEEKIRKELIKKSRVY